MSPVSTIARLPVRPVLDRLLDEARELQTAILAHDPHALQLLATHHDRPVHPDDVVLADAQQVVAKRYQASSWHRLVQACQLCDAIWNDDLATIQGLVTRNRTLLFEQVLIRRDSNWGPPMSYAANVGRDAIIQWLHDAGATDHVHALGRAALQGKISSVRLLHELAGAPPVNHDMLGGPAYTLNASGNAALLALGVPVVSTDGERLAPVCVVLETDSRRPEAKHTILDSWAEHGLSLPDTPTMALHRGRIDLLEAHLARDPELLHRRFRHREIYPSEMGCRDPLDATEGTPLDGTTLLHMAIEFDEGDIAEWCLARGADVNARAHVGASGFGGYTPLFNCVVSMPGFWLNYHGQSPYAGDMAALLLKHGADPNIRASVWKRLHPGHGDSARHDYRDVTARSYGERFHARVFVNNDALNQIIAAGGVA
ncbi:MAG: ankyrin repeat domain-containing protein [Gemmatimonadaceae bacterium]|nr:ankyrin repeat domain-containing protein [Gemmatimonadaceae bacterium]